MTKKIAKSLGRNEVGDAKRLERNSMSKVSLDHIIKERYPTFIDALRDLDDALSLLFLFANLPATSTVPPKTITLCRRLCLEFEHYIISANALRKSFLSIKGIYYQATIQGQDIMWLVPYKFVQRVTADVDFRIMGTFVEFYITLLGFVNFRLYTTIGLVYPPKLNRKSDQKGAELGALTIEGKLLGTSQKAIINGETQVNGHVNGGKDQLEADKEIQERVNQIMATIGTSTPRASPSPEPQEPVDEAPTMIDTFPAPGANADTLYQPQLSSSEAANLFAPFTFFLSRETPRQPLEFILRAFGCKRVGWDIVLGDGAFTSDERDPAITHQVIDRPVVSVPFTDEENAKNQDAMKNSKTLPPGSRVPGRTYIQPQWIWDSINAGELMQPHLYGPGAILPPHLSPWVKPKSGEYDPRVPLEEQQEEGEDLSDEEDGQEAGEQINGLEVQDIFDIDGPAVTDASTKSEVSITKFAQQKTQKSLPKISNDVLPDDHGMTIDLDSGMNSDTAADSTKPVDEFSGFSPSPSPSPEPTTQDLYEAELLAETQNLPPDTPSNQIKSILKKSKPSSKAREEIKKKRKAEQEEFERRRGMMSRKKQKVLDRVMVARGREEDEAKKLRAKKRKLEKGIER